MSVETPPTLPSSATPPPLAYKDRRAFLIVFGIIEILLGALCALLFAGLVLIQVLMSDEIAEAAGGQQFFYASGLIYLLAAVFLIWMGIGSILARRWARALMLTVSAIGLVCGVVSFISMCVFMPRFMGGTLPEESGMPHDVPTVFLAIMLGVMFCIYIFLPGVFVLFYRSPHVKATCEHRDPVVRWTDKCPLPVLAVSILCGFGGASVLLMALFMPVFPFFGTLLTGPLAMVLMGAMAVVSLLLSWGTYRLRPGAWWGCLAMVVIGGVCSGITFLFTDFREFYAAMGFPEKQIEMLEKTGMTDMMSSPGMVTLMAGSMVLYLAYLVYVRRFFSSAA